jgi:hypothetical protein
MKIQCEKCKEIVSLGRFDLLSDRIRITCPACDATLEVRAAGEVTVPASAAVPDADDGTCPKCGAPLADVPACAACGLERQHVEAYRARTAAADAATGAGWDACLAAWDDAAAHDAFVRRASLAGDYSSAAKHYRRYLQEHPGDATATAALARVTRMAEVALLQRPAVTAEAEQPYKRVVVLMMVLVVMAALGGAYLIMKRVTAPDPADSLPAPASVVPASNPGQGGGIVRPVRRSP